MASIFEIILAQKKEEELKKQQELLAQKKEDFFSIASKLPMDKQNFSTLSQIANRVGVSSETVNDWLKIVDSEIKRKQSIHNLNAPSKDKFPPAQTQLTPFIFDLLKKQTSNPQDLQSLQTPKPLQRPFGQINGQPANLQDIQDIIGQQLPVRQNTPLQPNLGVFGEQALQGLPQVPDITKAVPTSLVDTLSKGFGTGTSTGAQKLQTLGNDREAISLSINNKNFIEQDLKTKRIINRKVFNNQIALKRQQTLAQIEVNRNAELTAEERSHTYNPVTLKQVKGGITVKQANRMNAVWVDDSQKKDLRDMARINLAVESIDKLSNQVITAASGGVLPQNVQGVKLAVGGATRFDEVAGLYIDARNGLASLYSKYFGESGRLTEEDIKRAKSLMPSLNDTKKMRDFKIKQLKAFVDLAHTMLIEEVRGNFDAIPIFRKSARDIFDRFDEFASKNEKIISEEDFLKSLP